MTTKRDITRLPKWAQSLIVQMESENVVLEQGIADLKSQITTLQITVDRKKSTERIADLDRRILSQVNAALGDAITQELVGYDKPLSKIVERVIGAHDADIYKLVNDEFAGLLAADAFRVALKDALNAKLARVLIQRMGGELESQVNELKRNPQTNALITLAITGVVAELMTKEQ